MEQNLFFVLFMFMLALVTPVHAYQWGAGDTVALLLFLFLGFLAIFAVLGWWARRSGAA